MTTDLKSELESLHIEDAKFVEIDGNVFLQLEPSFGGTFRFPVDPGWRVVKKGRAIEWNDGGYRLVTADSFFGGVLSRVGPRPGSPLSAEGWVGWHPARETNSTA